MTLVTQHIDTLTTDLMRLKYLAHEIKTLLESQSEVLKLRELGLPREIMIDSLVLDDTMQQLAEQVEEEQNELAQLRALTSTAALINSSLEWEEVIPRAMDIVIGLTDAERGYIMLRDEKSGEWEIIVARNMDKTTIEDSEINFSRSIVDEVIRTAKPVLTSDAAEDSRFKFEDSIMRYDMRSVMCVPLVYQNMVSGVIYVDNPFQKGSFGNKELRLMAAFSNQAAIAIENARLFEQVRSQIEEVNDIRQFLDNVFASIGSGVITTDTEGNIRTFSPAAEMILELTYADTVGQRLVDVLPALYEGFENVLEAIQAKGTIEIIEISTVLPQRGPSYLSLKLSSLRDESGNTLGVAMVVDDLTELKKRDETLNVIQTYLPPKMVSEIQSIDSLGLGGEERQISSIFADVRGFTTFSENLEPETLMEIINQYLTIGADAINDHEGIIDKYMGDAIVGLFNTQLNTHHNHAERAVRTAIATIDRVRDFHPQLPEDHRLCYGVGIHTGQAMLGNVGSPSRKEFTAIGNAVTYAKKLQEIAQPNEIIISKETYDEVQDFVEVQQIERIPRASTKPIHAYLVLGLKA